MSLQAIAIDIINPTNFQQTEKRHKQKIIGNLTDVKKESLWNVILPEYIFNNVIAEHMEKSCTYAR